MGFTTVHAAFDWLIKQRRARSFLECWRALLEWEEGRLHADVKRGPGRQTLERFKEIEARIENPATKGTALRNLDSFTKGEHPEVDPIV